MPFIPHWSLRTQLLNTKNKLLWWAAELQSLVFGRFVSWNNSHSSPAGVIPMCFLLGFLTPLPLPPTRTSHIDSWFFSVTKIICPSLWNGITSNKLSFYKGNPILGGLIPPGTSILIFYVSKILASYWKITSNCWEDSGYCPMFANLQNLARLEVLSLKLMWYKSIFIYKSNTNKHFVFYLPLY